MQFHKTFRVEKQIENSNIQLNINMVTPLVLKYNAFKESVNFQKLYFPLTLMLTSSKNGNLIYLNVLKGLEQENKRQHEPTVKTFIT